LVRNQIAEAVNEASKNLETRQAKNSSLGKPRAK